MEVMELQKIQVDVDRVMEESKEFFSVPLLLQITPAIVM
jgi:hypothetical protein